MKSTQSSKLRKGKQSLDDEKKFKTAVLVVLAKAIKKENGRCKFTLVRSVTTTQQMFEKLGPDAGFDSINDQGGVASQLNALLNAFEEHGHLPRTILYNLNPIYNDLDWNDASKLPN